jgi:hypothetical protein
MLKRRGGVGHLEPVVLGVLIPRKESNAMKRRHSREQGIPTLRHHERLADYYKDIPVPAEETGMLGFIRSFFLTS